MELKHRFRFFFNLDYHYAFVQVILMVMSILIAFWIDTWWQNKQDIETEKAYLQALKIELEENQTKYSNHLQTLRQDIATTNAFIQLLNTNEIDAFTADTLQKYLWPLKSIEIIVPNRAALDDLINSGGMQYIRSDILRREIATYRQQFEYDMQSQNSVAERWENNLSVFNLEELNLSKIIPSGGIEGIPGEKAIKLPQYNFSTNFSRQDRKILTNRLLQRIFSINHLRKAHQSVLQNIRTLLFQLDIQLNPQPQTTTFEG